MTKIEWCDETWNPITGCSPISEGCQNCYARRMAKRLAGRFGYPDAPKQFDIRFHASRMEQPSKWTKSRKIFVCSMGDMFHKSVLSGSQQAIFREMHNNLRHTYMLLTKRPENIDTEKLQGGIWATARQKHIWLGVTTENQKRADERIPILLQIPAAVRFVSVEPMLGPVDLTEHYYTPDRSTNLLTGVPYDWDYDEAMPDDRGESLDWVIAGPETGPGARECKPEWIEDLYEQCKAAGVPFFDKRKDYLAREFP